MVAKRASKKAPTSFERMLGDKMTFTTTEASRLLNVNRSTISRWINQGGLPVMPLPGERRIPRWAIEQAYHCQPMTPPTAEQTASA